MESQLENSEGSSENDGMFVQKAARSIAEIQSNVNNLGDVLVFLEVLGYSDIMVREHGFEDREEFARTVFKYVQYYNIPALATEFYLPVPSMARRVAEALSLAMPWVGAWSLLLIFGVSLWLSERLPEDITTAFLIGVFLGIVTSGGQIQASGRLLSLYRSQSNLGEIRRILKRNYLFLSMVLIAETLFLYGAIVLLMIPLNLLVIAVLGTATISLHLASYTIVYVLGKIEKILASYGVALVVLLSVYFGSVNLVPDLSTRYFLALLAAFALLSVTALYYNIKVFRNKDATILLRSFEKSYGEEEVHEKPFFYSPVSSGPKTIESRFAVQLWESLSHYFFGVFFLALMFGDRILSWIYNTNHSVGGISYPMLFNPIYHIGADTALLVLFPATILQYVMIGSMYEHIHNISLNIKVTEQEKMNLFIQERYRKMLVLTALSSSIAASLLIYFGPQAISRLGGSEVSAQILIVAALANILMSIFEANALFLVFFNRIKSLVGIAIVGTLIIVALGMFLGQMGFQDIVYGYMGMNIVVVFLSSAEIKRNMSIGSSLYLARFA